MAPKPASIREVKHRRNSSDWSETQRCLEDYLRALRVSPFVMEEIISEVLAEAATRTDATGSGLPGIAFDCLQQHPRILRALQVAQCRRTGPEMAPGRMIPEPMTFPKPAKDPGKTFIALLNRLSGLAQALTRQQPVRS